MYSVVEPRMHVTKFVQFQFGHSGIQPLLVALEWKMGIYSLTTFSETAAAWFPIRELEKMLSKYRLNGTLKSLVKSTFSY